jgi:membrane protein
MPIGDLFKLLKDASTAFFNAHPCRLAAAISFYAAFSLAPLTVLGVMITGWYAQDPGFLTNLSHTMRALLGAQNARTVEGMVSLVAQDQWTFEATAFGVFSLLFGASGVFGEVQAALNTIWDAPTGESFWKGYLRQRAWTFVMLFCTGALLAGSLTAFAFLTVLSNYFASRADIPFDGLRVGHGLLSFVLVSAIFSLVYKALPDVVLRWKDVLLGGVVTSILFTTGKAVMGWYLGRFGLASVYGPAAALMAILFWLYYSSLIFVFGAHLTYVYARRYGSLAPPPGSGLPPQKPRAKKPPPPLRFRGWGWRQARQGARPKSGKLQP